MYQPYPCLNWPEIWLMTDERNDHCLEKSLALLPKASGIVFRHYHLDKDARHARFMRVKTIAQRHNHLLSLADTPELARQWGADGVHGRQWKGSRTAGLFHSAPVHDVREINMARKNGADIFFLSPAFTTQSHPGRKPMHKIQLQQLARICDGPVILLGGMNAGRFEQCRYLGIQGWAAIDALAR